MKLSFFRIIIITFSFKILVFNMLKMMKPYLSTIGCNKGLPTTFTHTLTILSIWNRIDVYFLIIFISCKYYHYLFVKSI